MEERGTRFRGFHLRSEAAARRRSRHYNLLRIPPRSILRQLGIYLPDFRRLFRSLASIRRRVKQRRFTYSQPILCHVIAHRILLPRFLLLPAPYTATTRKFETSGHEDELRILLFEIRISSGGVSRIECMENSRELGQHTRGTFSDKFRI